MLKTMISITEQEMRQLTANQCTDRDSIDDGGIVLPENGYAEPTDSGHAIEGLYGLYIAGGSSYTDEEIRQRVNALLDHLLKRQHQDGTQDLMSTNFHDTSSIAFAIQYLYYTFLLAAGREDELSVQLREKLARYFSKGASALAYGGFHTPNHRWVIASAISQLLHLIETGELSVEPALVSDLQETFRKYLGEGIDMDEQGEYTEKSVGIYNIHCNNSLLIMEECGRKLSDRYFEPGQLLKYVKGNLDLMPAYIDPDGSLFSSKSTRQDSNYKIYPDPYFINYLIYGDLTDDREYKEKAAQLLTMNKTRSRRSMECLCRLLYNRNLLSDLPVSENTLSPKDAYFNSQFGLYRRNTENSSHTIAAGSPFFYRYARGSNTVNLRLTASWYGEKGQFIPAVLEQINDHTFQLSWENTWGYIKPFASAPPTSVWETMDHESREKAHMHTLSITAIIRIEKEWTDIEIQMDTDCIVPYKLEAVYKPDGQFRSGTEEIICRGWADTELIAAGNYSYSYENSVITVDGGFAEHRRGDGMRGSESLVPGSFTVTSTGKTPDKRCIRIY